MSQYWANLESLLSSKTPFASVTLVDIVASAPQNVGAKMLVTSAGLHSGTVGGGKIEARAITEAMALIEAQAANRFTEWNLQTDIGMTCGGVVKLFFETYNIATWPIVIFGAGHCAQALVRLLMTLHCHITVIDSRRDWLAKLPPPSPADAGKLLPLLADGPLATYVAELPPSSFVLSMTMGHATDLPILIEALQSAHFPYLGVIGSDAKAAALHRGLRESGLSPEAINTVLCPIGLPIGSNDPAEIALSIAAQMLQYRGDTRR